MDAGNNFNLCSLNSKKNIISSPCLYLPEAGIVPYIGDRGSKCHTSWLEDKVGIGVSGRIYSSKLNTLM